MSEHTYIIHNKVSSLEARYDPNHDLFDDAIQVNIVDANILAMINLLAFEVERLERIIETLQAK